ncbi:MAG TPA: hypothetical protein VF222_02430 [Nitrososphaeraceae archaeon]
MAKQQQLLNQESPVSEVLNRFKKELTKNIERQIPVPNFRIVSEESKQEASISQIIRMYGKQFKQIRKQYTDGLGGRCVMGLIMSYYGWDGKCITNAERKLYAALVALQRAGISKELLIELNDSGATFDDIADYLDNNFGLASSNR